MPHRANDNLRIEIGNEDEDSGAGASLRIQGKSPTRMNVEKEFSISENMATKNESTRKLTDALNHNGRVSPSSHSFARIISDGAPSNYDSHQSKNPTTQHFLCFECNRSFYERRDLETHDCSGSGAILGTKGLKSHGKRMSLSSSERNWRMEQQVSTLQQQQQSHLLQSPLMHRGFYLHKTPTPEPSMSPNSPSNSIATKGSSVETHGVVLKRIHRRAETASHAMMRGGKRPANPPPTGDSSEGTFHTTEHKHKRSFHSHSQSHSHLHQPQDQFSSPSVSEPRRLESILKPRVKRLSLSSPNTTPQSPPHSSSTHRLSIVLKTPKINTSLSQESTKASPERILDLDQVPHDAPSSSRPTGHTSTRTDYLKNLDVFKMNERRYHTIEQQDKAHFRFHQKRFEKALERAQKSSLVRRKRKFLSEEETSSAPSRRKNTRGTSQSPLPRTRNRSSSFPMSRSPSTERHTSSHVKQPVSASSHRSEQTSHHNLNDAAQYPHQGHSHHEEDTSKHDVSVSSHQHHDKISLPSHRKSLESEQSLFSFSDATTSSFLSPHQFKELNMERRRKETYLGSVNERIHLRNGKSKRKETNNIRAQKLLFEKQRIIHEQLNEKMRVIQDAYKELLEKEHQIHQEKLQQPIRTRRDQLALPKKPPLNTKSSFDVFVHKKKRQTSPRKAPKLKVTELNLGDLDQAMLNAQPGNIVGDSTMLRRGRRRTQPKRRSEKKRVPLGGLRGDRRETESFEYEEPTQERIPGRLVLINHR
uniref:Uncharacterized protein n=1 Tax=Percolomonas cosmopolitus TaxID=63605 RepID=A0A7S1KQF7_9EUKA|mmetsp:Transcript_2952/g.11275  ORF Transcript_2952/g.11275 Transcript_2952/m.11275 type:complete len:759 (+) Transcript_2952:196-2472(+)|eukprot:CAMPEP_0117447552 /NCGR_PEP_ID=MMETSP0759-20121206/6936_1 /TAXON_ID=63605 /ORGANISM="Percolomonas cosmopolitus, Strain WS" /LENGTH=758 /DNA_ID=CAMNT_0005239895 /DNA_START=117 /DNA_END=2393 /DNA_ORIENTATION=+